MTGRLLWSRRRLALPRLGGMGWAGLGFLCGLAGPVKRACVSVFGGLFRLKGPAALSI